MQLATKSFDDARSHNELTTSHNTIIVGAGQAGLAASYHLKQRNIDHILIDRGRPGESWLSQRWDSFVLNTPNVANSLPGKPFHPESPGAFESPATLVEYFNDYIKEFDLPFEGGINVTGATRNADGTSIDVTTDKGNYQTQNLIVASGNQNVPTLPDAAKKVPANITSIDTSEYRNAAQLPEGAVLVVGSAQSGIQIAEDLLTANRTVYLATSKVGRFRRNFRGKDIVEWAIAAGMYKHTTANLENPEDQYAAQPIASGVDGGRTISLQSTHEKGAILLGRLEGFEGTTAIIHDDLRANIEYGDAFSAKIISMLDPAISKIAPDAPPLMDEPADTPAPASLGTNAPTKLDLDEAGITSIVWTTGFTGDYSWIDLEGHAIERGRPVQQDGASPAKGLYFIGTPWLRNRASGIIYGAGDDAQAIAEQIKA